MIKIDHFYVTVDNLDRAISFYESVLNQKITHREGNRWADFSNDNTVYLGIYDAIVDDEKFSSGSTPTLCLKTDDIEFERNRIIELGGENVNVIVTLTQPALYKYFWFNDPWGNKWEVADYSY